MSGMEGTRPPDPGAPGMPPAPSAAGGGLPPPVPPRGAAPYGYGPDLSGGRQSGERARKALWVGLGAFSVQAVCSVIVLASLSDFYLDLLDAVGSGKRLTTAQTTPPSDAAYLLASAVSQIASVAALVVAIIFLVWFHKALSNARALGLPLTRSPGWGVAGFFIPIINLWFPYQSMRDLLPEGNPARPLVGRWWASYLGAGFAASFAAFGALFAPVFGFVLAIVVIGLYAIAAVTLRELIAASTQAAESLAAGTAVPNVGWGTPMGSTPGAPGAPMPGAPAGGTTNGGAGWAVPPAGPPKDPWNPG